MLRSTRISIFSAALLAACMQAAVCGADKAGSCSTPLTVDTLGIELVFTTTWAPDQIALTANDPLPAGNERRGPRRDRHHRRRDSGLHARFDRHTINRWVRLVRHRQQRGVRGIDRKLCLHVRIRRAAKCNDHRPLRQLPGFHPVWIGPDRSSDGRGNVRRQPRQHRRLCIDGGRSGAEARVVRCLYQLYRDAQSGDRRHTRIISTATFYRQGRVGQRTSQAQSR